MIPPYFVGMATHANTELVNGAILAILTAFNVAIALGISGLRTDPGSFAFAMATAAGLAFIEYLAVYRGLRPKPER